MKKLIFIYNGDSGKVNAVVDWAHKLVSPSTYQCDLCNLTYGTFGQKKEWKKFVDSLGIDAEFIHRNDVPTEFKDLQPPTIVYLEDESSTIILTADEFKDIKDLDQLMTTIKDRLPGQSSK